MNRPEPQILILWRTLLTAAAIVPPLVFSLLFVVASPPWWVTMALVVLGYLFFYVYYTPRLYAATAYTITDTEIKLYTGVITTRAINIPIANIQFIAINRNLFARIFRLSTIVLTVPGGKARIQGLGIKQAEDIAEMLKEKLV